MADEHPRRSRSPAAPATAERARRIEEDVRTWHRRGREAGRLLAERTGGVGDALKGLIEGAGTNEATLRRARRFGRLYSDQQLEALLRLRTPEGLPLGWSHVQELIAEGRPKVRLALQRQAAREGWTARALKVEVRKLGGGGPARGGRKFTLPADPEGRLARLTRESFAWSRLAEEVVLSGRAGLEGQGDGVDREELRRRAGEALAALAAVQDKARRAVAVLRSLDGAGTRSRAGRRGAD